jgi:hypothetical protein
MNVIFTRSALAVMASTLAAVVALAGSVVTTQLVIVVHRANWPAALADLAGSVVTTSPAGRLVDLAGVVVTALAGQSGRAHPAA